MRKIQIDTNNVENKAFNINLSFGRNFILEVDSKKFKLLILNWMRKRKRGREINKGHSSLNLDVKFILIILFDPKWN